MTLTVELTPEQEARLRRKAQRLGLDLAQYVQSILDTEQPPDHMPKTGAEALVYWEKEGVLGTFADRPDSPAFARNLRNRAQMRGW